MFKYQFFISNEIDRSFAYTSNSIISILNSESMHAAYYTSLVDVSKVTFQRWIDIELLSSSDQSLSMGVHNKKYMGKEGTPTVKKLPKLLLATTNFILIFFSDWCYDCLQLYHGTCILN